jgi:DNA-binding CsgD family transcriptional regulator
MNGTQTTESPTVPKGLHHQRRGKQNPNPIRIALETNIKAMIQQGSSVRKIAAALSISPNTVQRVRNQMTALLPAEDRKSGLLSPVRDEKVGKLIDHFLDKGVKLKKIKGSDALGAVREYAARRWPVRSEAPPQVKLYVNVDLGQFRPDPLDSAQDVTPTTTSCVSADGKQTEGENLNQFKGANVS